MKDQVLSIEQMQHLKELGVDTSQASMVLIVLDCNNNIIEWDEIANHKEDEISFKYFDAEDGNYDHSYRKDCGVFTLQDILNLLPKKIERRFEEYELTFFYSITSYKWTVQYLNEGYSFMDYFSGNNLISAAYQILLWCIKEDYI